MRQIIDRIIYGIAGSVGNLGATEKKEHVREVFLGTFFLVAAGYGLAAIALYELLDIFVASSFGAQYVFPKLVTMVLCINFFLNGVRRVSLIFRDSLGLFWNDRYKTIVESLVNLVTSIILARKLGTAGVFIGTFISIVGVSMWVEPLVLYKDYFQAPVSEYFRKLAKYCILFALAWGATDSLNRVIPWGSELIQYLGMIVISIVIPVFFLVVINLRTPEFRFVMSHLHPKQEEHA